MLKLVITSLLIFCFSPKYIGETTIYKLKKKIWCETTTRLPLLVIAHILNFMKYIFFKIFINEGLLFAIRSGIIKKSKASFF